MSEQQEPYMTATAPIGNISTVSFDVTPAERNLIMRLRQHRGMLIIDADSMCWWCANKMEQGNGKTPQVPTLPYRMDFA